MAEIGTAASEYNSRDGSTLSAEDGEGEEATEAKRK